MLKRKLILSLLSLLILGAVLPVQGKPIMPDRNVDPAQVTAAITLPPGFEITVFSNQVPGARSMVWTPNGTLFVGTRNAGIVYALRDDDRNFMADGVLVIARNLNSPNGVAFHDGSLYVAEINRVLRYDNIEASLTNPPQPVVVNAGFPTDQHHGWKFIRIGPDEKLYVPVGSPCNACETVDPRYGTIMRMNLDGTEVEIVAQGIRNTVGFDWDPVTEELWFTDNARDDLGDNVPLDELNHITEPGQHFGYPYCHGNNAPDRDFGLKRDCTKNTVAPAIELGPHVAPLGMRFYAGEQFPEEYHNQIFIAEHGSASRSVPAGYRVMLVRLDEAGAAIAYEPFAEGWLQPNGVLGRPVDVEILPDGSMLVSDDFAGVIYRIAYVGEN